MKLTPHKALELIGHIAALDWRKLDANDRASFADAGPDARIAEVSLSRSAAIVELIEGDQPNDKRLLCELKAIIGGDALQIELAGCDIEGDPVAYSIPLAIVEG